MKDLIMILIGFVISVGIFLIYRVLRGRSSSLRGKGSTKIFSTIHDLRAVGELVVFKVITKEIVTAQEHWFGEAGKKYFLWAISTKKMAMVFEFGIDFKYDLQSPDFLIEEKGDGAYRLTMPKCFYETHIRDISFYDEQNAKLLPWLLPDMLNRAFGMGFSEEDKNRLKDEAKYEASRRAKELVQKMRSEVQNSARKTVEVLAKGFGVKKVILDFDKAELVQLKVNSEEKEAAPK